MKTLSRLSMLLMLLFGLVSVAPASDKAKEKRWASQVEDNLMIGDAVWLQAGKDRFLGLYTAAKGKPKNAAIVMHGIGVHPNWTDVVQPVRHKLPEQGWSTLSIQMPILRNQAQRHEYSPLLDEVPARLHAAIAWLKQKGHTNIVLIAHSMGNTMTVYALSKDPKIAKKVKAYVAISFMAPFKKAMPGKNEMIALQKVSLPMYDLYGKDDKQAVRGAKKRKKYGSMAGKYDQHGVKDAGHFFRGKNEELVKLVLDWIKPFGK